MERQFRCGIIDDNYVENADETHVLVNVDNGRTLVFAGDAEIKYADVVSRGEAMTMVVRISGWRDALLEAPFMVFQNKSRSYPIRKVPVKIDGASCRSGPKGWMDRKVFADWW